MVIGVKTDEKKRRLDQNLTGDELSSLIIRSSVAAGGPLTGLPPNGLVTPK